MLPFLKRHERHRYENLYSVFYSYEHSLYQISQNIYCILRKLFIIWCWAEWGPCVRARHWRRHSYLIFSWKFLVSSLDSFQNIAFLYRCEDFKVHITNSHSVPFISKVQKIGYFLYIVWNWIMKRLGKISHTQVIIIISSNPHLADFI